MTNRKSAVRRPQSSKREREMAKLVKLYPAGTGESVTVPAEPVEYATDAR
jgi:hypothetical protein